MPDEILDTREAAKLLKCSEEHIRVQAKKRNLPGTQLGTKWCFSREQLIEWVRNGGKTTKRL